MIIRTTNAMNAFDTYKQSQAFKVSHEGFDKRSYSGWKECFEVWAIPLAIEASVLRDELDDLKLKLKQSEGSNK